MMTLMSLLYAVIGFCVAVLFGLWLIPMLRKLHFGQTILTEYGPSWHAGKTGTPMMGGFMFILASVAVYLIFGFRYYTASDVVFPTTTMLGLIVSLLFAFLGFADDFVKATKKQNLGLTAWQKLLIQILIGGVYLFVLAMQSGGNTSVRIPFTSVTLDLGWFYYVLCLIIIVGFTNAVNLTDGVDGLCGTVTVPVCMFFAVAALFCGQTNGELAILASALCGGIIGFLVYNWHPAKVFMGDTGSMFLGGMIVTFAFTMDMPLILLVVGIIYLIEAFSVMIQVTYFKITHGKRIFKMTPIHHHFEMSGYSEVKIVVLFSVVSLLACLGSAIWLVFNL